MRRLAWGLGWGAAVAAAVAWGSGCRGARYADGVYDDGKARFRLPNPPPSWRPVDVRDASLAFRDDAAAASILVNARCTGSSSDVPLAALTRHLLIGTTERETLAEETLPLDGREALRSRVAAKLDGVPLVYEMYVLKKDGCVYDFVLVRRHDPSETAAAVERATEPFRRFVLGFRTEGDGT